jgi:hypothetical protein
MPSAPRCWVTPRRSCSASDPRRVSDPQLPIPVACGSLDLVVVRDGDHRPGLVRDGPHRLGGPAHRLRLAAVPGHARRAHVRGAGRPGGRPPPAVHDARDLRGPRRPADAAGAHRRARPGLGVPGGGPQWHLPPQRPGDAELAHRRDDPSGRAHGRDRHVARHHGLRPGGRRARGGRPLHPPGAALHLPVRHRLLPRGPRPDPRGGPAATGGGPERGRARPRDPPRRARRPRAHGGASSRTGSPTC